MSIICQGQYLYDSSESFSARHLFASNVALGTESTRLYTSSRSPFCVSKDETAKVSANGLRSSTTPLKVLAPDISLLCQGFVVFGLVHGSIFL